MQKFAFYDLDRTILRRPTFTLFLFWAAAVDRPWRLLMAPLWLLLALGYVLRLYSRNIFKPTSIRLLLGRRISAERMDRLARRFAAWRIPADVPPGAAATIAQDRADGYRLVLATAAPEFYARTLADALDFDAVIATRHQRSEDGDWLAGLDGENCYGREKARRVTEWLAAQDDDDAGRRHIRAYSDHPSDAALFALVDQATLIGRKPELAALAARNGWTLRDFSKTA